jgi:hypothetical protein
MVMDIGSLPLGLGSYVSPYLRTVRRYQSLLARAVIPSAPSRVSSVARSMPGLSPRKPRRWQITINVTTPVAASNSCNNGMELASKHNVQPRSITHRHSLGERYPQWHGIGLNNATSNLAEPLTAMSSEQQQQQQQRNNNRRKTHNKHRK